LIKKTDSFTVYLTMEQYKFMPAVHITAILKELAFCAGV
jgi:hypothetical protein